MCGAQHRPARLGVRDQHAFERAQRGGVEGVRGLVETSSGGFASRALATETRRFWSRDSARSGWRKMASTPTFSSEITIMVQREQVQHRGAPHAEA
ncbi:hypothetical protein BH09MYX1_BH09MYX1_03920 [soil metagenome]